VVQVRHPMAEALLAANDTFVPNDLALGASFGGDGAEAGAAAAAAECCLIITGP
jgi:DNA mismatch repair ATPase MutS